MERLDCCMSGERLWDCTVGSTDLPGGVDCRDVWGWWNEAASRVLAIAGIECGAASKWDGPCTGRFGGFKWWGEPTAEERAAIERADAAGGRAVCESALRFYEDDVRHWAQALAGDPGDDYAREAFEGARGEVRYFREALKGTAE